MNLNAFFNSAAGNAVKVALFAGVSAFIASLKVDISTKQGASFALVNAVLVFVQGWLSPTTPTLPGSTVSPPVAGGTLDGKVAKK